MDYIRMMWDTLLTYISTWASPIKRVFYSLKQLVEDYSSLTVMIIAIMALIIMLLL